MFEKIDQENQKRIEAIRSNISKAETKINKLKNGLNLEDMDHYSDSIVRINSYQEYIKENEEQIKLIEANPYRPEDCCRERDRIRKLHNGKLEKAYSDLVNQINKLCESYEQYEQVTSNFTKDRNELNARAAMIDCEANVYEGEGIKNDHCLKYRYVILNLKKIVSQNGLK